MANIDSYIEKIQNAVYGEEVRSAIINSLEKVNDDNNSYQSIKTEIINTKNDIDDTVEYFDTKVANAKTTYDNLVSATNTASSTRSSLQSATTTANTAKTNLTSATTTANTAKSNLEAATTNANNAVTNATTAKSNLDTSISSAGTAKTNLTSATSAANTAKNNLETVTAEAKTATEEGSTTLSNLNTAIDEAESLTDVLSVGEKVDQCLAILSADGIYGFIEHNNVLSPTERIEYIGVNKNYKAMSLNKSTGDMTYNDWADFPVIKANKPWMVKYDGTPDYRLNESDYTLREDGTASDVENTDYQGGAFSWIPKIYKQEYMLGDDRVVKFCMNPKDGFEPVGFIDPDNNELEGVWIPMFYCSSETGAVRPSIAGLYPTASTTTDREKALMGSYDRLKFFGGAIVETLIDLLIMFAKTTNLQEAYGYGNSSGYNTSDAHNGVLKNAVAITNVTYGTTSKGSQFYGTSNGKDLNRIFHSIVLGSYQIYLRDPYTLLVKGRYKVSKNYTYDLTGDTYTDTGITQPEMYNSDGGQDTDWKYPHKYQTVPGFGALPVYPFNGSTSTGGCNGYAQNCEITAVARRFGCCWSGSRVLYVNNMTTNANWNIGAALFYLKQNNNLNAVSRLTPLTFETGFTHHDWEDEWK